MIILCLILHHHSYILDMISNNIHASQVDQETFGGSGMARRPQGRGRGRGRGNPGGRGGRGGRSHGRGPPQSAVAAA